jgi:hypothetical protein
MSTLDNSPKNKSRDLLLTPKCPDAVSAVTLAE